MTTAEFRIGEAFPPGDPVARWLTALAMSHNDIRHANLRMIDAACAPPERLYYFRLVASHYKEIAEDLKQAYSEWEEVREFVDALGHDAQQDFRRVLQISERYEADLGRLRNTMFHYLELDKRGAAKGREKLQNAMRSAAVLRGQITSGDAFGTVRLDYADEVVVQLIGDNDAAELLMEAVRDGVLAFWRFCHWAFQAYLGSLSAGAVTLRDA
jgi:hypothetical protein